MTPKSTTFYLCSLRLVYQKYILFNFHYVFCLTSTMPAQVHQKFCESFMSTLEDMTLPSLDFFFSYVCAGFSRKIIIKDNHPNAP